MNTWKIIYLNCGERYEFMIDHRSYTHNLSNHKFRTYLLTYGPIIRRILCVVVLAHSNSSWSKLKRKSNYKTRSKMKCIFLTFSPLRQLILPLLFYYRVWLAKFSAFSPRGIIRVTVVGILSAPPPSPELANLGEAQEFWSPRSFQSTIDRHI